MSSSCCQGFTNDDDPIAPESKKEGLAYVFDMDALPVITFQVHLDDWNLLLEKYVANDTQEDMEIEDLPGKYSDQQDYRLWEDGAMNFFRVKCKSLQEVK